MSVIKVNFSSGMFMVPESFVDKFIKDTNASFIKLYIYILRHANDAEALTLEKISADTGLLKSDVVSALNYWQQAGVLNYGNTDKDGYINVFDSPHTAVDAKSVDSADSSAEELLPQKKFRKNSVTSTYQAAEVVKTVNSDKKLKSFFDLVGQMLNKSLTPVDYKTLYSFIDYLKLPEQVIIILVEYCVSISKTAMRYIETIAYSWADSGIISPEAAEQYVREQNEKHSLLKKYKRKFKITGRDFTDSEAKYIYDWVHKLKAQDDMIMMALDKSVLNTGKISLKYMDAVIKGELKEVSKPSEAPSNVKKSNFRNYPADYGVSEDEKKMIEKMMAEYEGGITDADNE